MNKLFVLAIALIVVAPACRKPAEPVDYDIETRTERVSGPDAWSAGWDEDGEDIK